MITISDYKPILLPDDIGIERLVDQDKEWHPTITSLSQYKKVKFEIESYTKEGKATLA